MHILNPNSILKHYLFKSYFKVPVNKSYKQTDRDEKCCTKHNLLQNLISTNFLHHCKAYRHSRQATEPLFGHSHFYFSMYKLLIMERSYSQANISEV